MKMFIGVFSLLGGLSMIMFSTSEVNGILACGVLFVVFSFGVLTDDD